MQAARIEGEGTKPGGTKRELVADDHVQIIAVPRRASRRQSGLLYRKIVSGVVVLGSSQKPLRTIGLRPIDARRTERVAKGNRHVVRNGDGIHPGNQPLRGERSERIELRKAGRTVSDAGVFVLVLERSKKPNFALHNRPANGG